VAAGLLIHLLNQLDSDEEEEEGPDSAVRQSLRRKTAAGNNSPRGTSSGRGSGREKSAARWARLARIVAVLVHD
jgi:hypothetical protein